MIRFFSTTTKAVVTCKNSACPLYSYNGGSFVRTSQTLGAGTKWATYNYAYDESTNFKYFQVSTNQYLRLDGTGGINLTMPFNTLNGNSGRYNISVYRWYDQYVITHSSLKADQEHREYDNGSYWAAAGSFEEYSKTRYLTGFLVSTDYYFDSGFVIPDSPVYSAKGPRYSNVKPLKKLIRINSAAPDYFDYNGNAVDGMTFNFGDQIISDGFYHDTNRVGFEVKSGVYINIADALPTEELNGYFLPERQGVN
jgi:hypothetical protein